jgi:hypothetical protein
MRRSACLLLLFLPAGCFSSSSGGPSPDASFNEQPDAEFSDSAPAEATAPAEASIDASLDATTSDVTVPEASVDAGPAPVTVAVSSALGPEQGVTVVFQDATGAILSSGTTDATGTASGGVPAGGQATVLLGTSLAPAAYTIQGVAPGDTLAVYDTSSDAIYDSDSVSIDSWSSGAPAGTANYTAYIGACERIAAMPPIVDTANQCSAAGHFGVLLEATGDADAGSPTLGYTWQNGNTLPTDGGTTHVNMAGAWSTTTASQTITVENAPAFTGSLNGAVTLSQIADGTMLSSSNSAIPADGGTAFPFYPGYPDFLQSEVRFDNFTQFFAVATRGAPGAGSGTTTLDLSQLPPYITTAAVDSSVVSQPSVTWSVQADAGATGAFDGVLVVVGWAGTNDAGVNVRGTWSIVAPPTSTKVQVPAIPGGSSAWAPLASQTYPVVVLVDATYVSGYAQFRSSIAALPLTTAIGSGLFDPPVVPPLTSNGTLSVSGYFGGGS